MKKNKIIGISVALLGTAISIGTAAALYKKDATPAEFSFGAFTYDAKSGDIDYLVGNPVTVYEQNALTDSSDHGLAPDHRQVWVKAPISASYPSTEGVIAQSTIGGKLTATVTLSDALASAGVTMETAVYVNGYEENTYYTKGNNSKAIDNTTLNSTTKSVSGNVEVGVKTVATKNSEMTLSNCNYVVVWMSFSDALTDSLMLSLGGSAAYSIHIGWTSMTAVPHVVGDANNFTEVDEFGMVPVIDQNIDFVKWTFQGLTGFSKMKVKDGEAWIGAAQDGDDMGNVQIASDSSYNVYYKAGNSGLSVSSDQHGTNYITNV